jgi:hypothetical protein
MHKREARNRPIDISGVKEMSQLNRAMILTLLGEETSKAAGHKYDRRFKGKDGKWQYVYSDTKKRKGSASDRHSDAHAVDIKMLTHGEFNKGDSVSAGAGEGHFVIDNVDEKGRISYYHDEDGRVKTASNVKEFRKVVREANKPALQRHAAAGFEKRKALVEALHAPGSGATASQLKRARAELDSWSKSYKTVSPELRGQAAEHLDKHALSSERLAEARKVGTAEGGKKRAEAAKLRKTERRWQKALDKQEKAKAKAKEKAEYEKAKAGIAEAAAMAKEENRKKKQAVEKRKKTIAGKKKAAEKAARQAEREKAMSDLKEIQALGREERKAERASAKAAAKAEAEKQALLQPYKERGEGSAKKSKRGKSKAKKKSD